MLYPGWDTGKNIGLQGKTEKIERKYELKEKKKMRIGTILPHSKKLLEANREAGTAFSLGPSEGAWPHQHLHVRILTSRTMRQQVSVV